MKLSLYRVGTTLGGPLIRLYLNMRLKRGKEDPARFKERLGHASLPRPEGKVVWMHCASVGESLSVLALIDRILADHPGWSVLMTTGTVTSAKLMADRLPQGAMHQYVPVDRVSYVRRFLQHWRPDLALWVESEFWPNLVIETHDQDVPMIVLNGRMSEKSFKGWQKNRAMMGRILSAFALVLAQSEKDGERFHTLGAKNVNTVGNLKFAAKPLPVTEAALAELKNVVGTRPVWLASSTHNGEEAICGRVHKMLKASNSSVLTIIVPRHPERGEAVSAELQAHGLNVARRAIGDAITDKTDIYVADTLGELGLFYRLSDIVFMGKTLAGGGGQNPIEPSALSCALIFGKDMSNFQDISSTLMEAGAARWVHDETELYSAVEILMNDEKARKNAASYALSTARAEAGVLERVGRALSPYFKNKSADNADDGDRHART